MRYGFLAGVGANAVVGIVQWSGLLDVFPFELTDGRSSGLLGNPLHLGSLCAAALILLAVDRALPGRWAYPAAALFGIGVAFSGSRSALALVGVGVLAAALRRSWGAMALVTTGLLVGLTAGAVWNAPGSAGGSAAARAVAHGGSIEARTATWATALRILGDDPLTGAGPGRFRAATTAHRPLAVARAEGPDRLFVDAHNIVVEYMTTTGLPGAALLLVALFLAFRGAADAGWLGCALVLVAAHLTAPQSVVTTPVFFLALGLAQPRRPSTLPVGRLHRASAAMACGVGMAAGAVLLRGDFLLNEARLDVELADARAAERLLPPWPEPARRMAIAYAFRAQSGGGPADERRAIRWFEIAARRSPDDPAGWSDLADRHLQNADLPAAESAYRRALRANQYSTRALNGLARTLLAGGRSGEARQVLERSLSVDPAQRSVKD
ncbi:MAG: O-antigen ligase family protein, partial [Actinomycetota bacterium]|nr:O-antigen ligase family protein [Actinomycetota bacterium]